jgi:hypothetical protein
MKSPPFLGNRYRSLLFFALRQALDKHLVLRLVGQSASDFVPFSLQNRLLTVFALMISSV